MDGPRNILKAAEPAAEAVLPGQDKTHPCEACLELYKSQTAKEGIHRAYLNKVPGIIFRHKVSTLLNTPHDPSYLTSDKKHRNICFGA